MDEREFARSAAMEPPIVRGSLNNLMGIVNGLVCDNNLTDSDSRHLPMSPVFAYDTSCGWPRQLGPSIRMKALE